MSDSVRPHRRQPTRLPHPWDSPGKNTGVEWVAISFSNAWKWKVKVKLLSCVWLLATPWTAAYQAPPSMGFSRQEYWSGMPLPSPHMSSGNCKHMSIRMAKIQNTDNIKCWWAFGATGMLIHCWWEWMKKGTATLKDSLSVSYKTEHTLTIQSCNQAPWYLLKEEESLCLKTCIWIFIAVFSSLQNLEVNKMFFSTWMVHNKLRYIQTMEYYSALKRSELSSCEKVCRHLKCISLSERSQC